MEKVTLKIHNEALQALYGDSIEVDASKTGIPKNRYWRNRLRDAKIDSCVEIVKPEAKTSTKARGEK